MTESSSYLPEKAALAFKFVSEQCKLQLDLQTDNKLVTQTLDLETFEDRLRPYGNDDNLMAMGDYLVSKAVVTDILEKAYSRLGIDFKHFAAPEDQDMASPHVQLPSRPGQPTPK